MIPQVLVSVFGLSDPDIFFGTECIPATVYEFCSTAKALCLFVLILFSLIFIGLSACLLKLMAVFVHVCKILYSISNFS